MMHSDRQAEREPGRDLSREAAEKEQTRFDLILDSCRRLLRRGAISNIGKMMNRLHPADIAKIIEHLSSVKEKRTVFELVRPETRRGQVLSELDATNIETILVDLTASDVAWLLKDLGPDDVAYILSVLEEERAKEILGLMKIEDSTDVAGLLKHAKDTAGAIMTTEFLALSEDTTAQEAISVLQRATDAEMVFYIYVMDKDERLVGVVSLRQLLTVPPVTPLKHIMARDVRTVTEDMDQEEVARQVANYNLLAIPVVDPDHRMLGIITVDDVVDVIREEATEDMLKMAGAAEEEGGVEVSSLEAAGHRLPWLFTNLVGSLFSGAILWWFRYTIQEVVAIVSFIPVIAAMAGNVGIQSSTLIIRGIALGRVEVSDLWKVVFREMRIGLLLGVICGVLLSAVGWLWHGGAFLGLVVGISLVISFLVSAGMAALTPFMLKRTGVDPAVAAGPFVSTVMDITGIAIYLVLATALLEHIR